MGSRDDNRVVVAMARNPSGDAQELVVDNSTGYLLVNTSSGSGSSATYQLNRDDNFVPVGNVVNPSGDVVNLSFDDSNNGLYIADNA